MRLHDQLRAKMIPISINIHMCSYFVVKFFYFSLLKDTRNVYETPMQHSEVGYQEFDHSFPPSSRVLACNTPAMHATWNECSRLFLMDL